MTVRHFTSHITDKNDASDTREAETRAFGLSKEADLVVSLLENEGACPMLSLLAQYEDKAVGHILSTQTASKGKMDSPLVYILAPLAVIPEYQGMDVEGRLMHTGIEYLRLMGYQTIFVLDHATYYPRHGFESCAGDRDYPAPYPTPEERKAYWTMQPPTAQPMTPTGHIRCAGPDGVRALTRVAILLCPF